MTDRHKGYNCVLRILKPELDINAVHKTTAFSFENRIVFTYYSGALAREARSGAPWVTKCGKLPIRENLTVHPPPALPTVRPHHRHTNTKFRVVCGEGFLAQKRMATRVL